MYYVFEEWKPIVGYEDYYEISNHGRVKSLERYVADNGGQKLLPEKILKGGQDRQGYRQINLWKNGISSRRRIHHLVLVAFIGPRQEGAECCHYDGNPANNHLGNLRWGSRSSNIEDKRRHGTIVAGIKNGRAILKNQDIIKIRELLKKKNKTQIEIANEFKVCRQSISNIKLGRTWAHV